MSVDYTTVTGYGFQISEEGMEKLNRKADKTGECVDEYLERKLDPMLTCVAAGSYMDGDVVYAISLKRLTRHHSHYSMGFQGFSGFDMPELTVEEDDALFDARIKYLSEDNKFGAFVGGLVS